MNKNLKRALNTTAAVSMSLAMVLGAVAPMNTTTVNAANMAVSVKTTAKNTQKFLAALLDDFKADYTEAYGKDTVTNTEADGEIDVATDIKIKLLAEAGNTLEKIGEAKVAGSETLDGIEKDTKIEALASYLADNYSELDEADQNEEVIAFAKFLAGYGNATEALVNGDNAIAKTDGQLNAEFKKHAKDVIEHGVSNYNVSSKYYTVLTDNAAYLNAVLVADNGKETRLEIINNFKTEVEDYKGENEDAFLSEYVELLEKVVIDGEDTTVYEAVAKEDKVSYKKLSEVEKTIKAIKNDTASVKVDGKDIKLSSVAKYDDVKDAEEVAEYIEGLEAIVEDMKEVKDLLKSTNSEIKAYNKSLKGKVETLVTVNNAYDTEKMGDADEENLAKALNAFNSEDRAALKEFVEGFVEQFYTLTPKQLSSGKYVVRLENADYGRYVDTDAVFGLITNKDKAGLQKLLTTPINAADSEETYYDVLVTTVSSAEDLYKAVTEDIEGLTLNSKITSVEANKIIKAKKALDQLVVNGTIATEYKDALSRAEEKEVLANVDLIETLYFKLILNGEVTTIGWVEDAKGWKYYDNSGNRVMEGWAAGNGYWSFMKNGYSVSNEWCAAKDGWYYMGADGKMVTGKVVIDGVEQDFGTDGIWVR